MLTKNNAEFVENFVPTHYTTREIKLRRNDAFLPEGVELMFVEKGELPDSGVFVDRFNTRYHLRMVSGVAPIAQRVSFQQAQANAYSKMMDQQEYEESDPWYPARS